MIFNSNCTANILLKITQMDNIEKKNELAKFFSVYKENDKTKGSLGNKKKKNKCLCTQEYIKKWEKIAKSKILSALACPKPVRLRPWPNPRFETTLPIPVARTALYGRIPSRIAKLAQPKLRKAFTVPLASSDDSISREFSPNSFNEGQKSRRSASRNRIFLLSKPKPTIRQVHQKCANSEYQEKKYFKPKYTREQNYSDSWFDHRKWLMRLAKPKKIFRRPPEKRVRLNMTKSQVEASVNRLATVAEHRKYVKKPKNRQTEPRPFGPLRPMDVDWVNRLSVPRKLSSETRLNLEFDPEIISRSALKAKASKRTEELAVPKYTQKTANDTELKENAFSVSSKALKYKATKRIENLATPRKR